MQKGRKKHNKESEGVLRQVVLRQPKRKARKDFCRPASRRGAKVLLSPFRGEARAGTKTKLARLDFLRMKEAILGKDYDLSVVFVGPAKMKALNRRYRGKDEPTDILSFPLSKYEGEIFLCLSEAKKEAPRFGRSFDNFLAFLFIHGLVHLKGYEHGSRMERVEQGFRKRFKI